MKSHSKLVPDLGLRLGSPWAPASEVIRFPYGREDLCWTGMDLQALPGMTWVQRKQGGDTSNWSQRTQAQSFTGLSGKVQPLWEPRSSSAKMGPITGSLPTAEGAAVRSIAHPSSSGNSRAQQRCPEPKHFLPPGGTILVQATELQVVAEVSCLPFLPLSLSLT